MKKRFVRRRKKGSVQFKPNHAYIDEAMLYYLNNGGKITRIEVLERDYKSFISTNEPPSSVDDFLAGQ